MRTSISEALRKALEQAEQAKLEAPTTTTPFVSQRAIPVPEHTGTGTEAPDSGMIPLSEVLASVLRPRPSVRKGKVIWERTFDKMRKIYDYLLYFAHKGYIKAEEHGEEFDLLETFYRVYPEARGQVKSLPVFLQDLLLDPESLEMVLSPSGQIFKSYFSRLVDITSKTRSGAGRSPDYLRLKEEVTRAYNSLTSPKGGESYKDILAAFLEAYLSYASKIRSLPKPKEG